MKPRKLTGLLLGLAALALILFPVDTRYTYSDDVEIVAHKADMYVLINAYNVGGRGPLIWALLTPAKTHHLLFHVSRRTVEMHDIPWGRDLCEPNAYDGKLCLDCSQKDRTIIFVSVDPTIRKMTDAEGRPIFDALIKDKYNGLHPWEGWRHIDYFDLAATVPATLPEKRTVVMLGKDKYTFIYRRYERGASSGESYSMQGPGFQQPEQLLYKWPTPTHNSIGY